MSKRALSSSTDSTFKFLIEQWKDQLPSGYLLKKAFVDHPFEEDACCCHFEFVVDTNEHSAAELDLKYQWFIGERTPSNFIAIPGACAEVLDSFQEIKFLTCLLKLLISFKSVRSTSRSTMKLVES